MSTNYLPHQTKTILSSIFLCLAFFAFSQEAIEVQITTAQMSEGRQPGYHVEIPKAELKTTQRNWVKKLQENIKVKVKKVDHEWVLAQAVKNELTKDTLSVYTIFIQKDDKIHMKVFIKIDDVFFSPDDDETKLSRHKTDNNIKSYIRNFALEEYKLIAGNHLQAAERSLKSAENELNRLIREKDYLIRSGSSIKRSIDSYERRLFDTNRQIFNKQKEIIDQQVYMRKLVNENERRAAVEKLRRLERQKYNLEKNRETYARNLAGARKKLDNNINKLNENHSGQVAARTEIAVQQKAIRYYQSILSLK